MAYNYQKFKLAHYNDHFDAFFGPKEGEAAIDFTARTLDGQTLRLSNFFGKPIILEMGSLTCNVYVEKVGLMNQIARTHPAYHHIVLYTREAHPGHKIKAHGSFAEKIQLAHRLVQTEKEYRRILVDDLDGTAHQAYGLLPNSLYIINTKGTVIYRDIWSSPKRTQMVLEHLKNNTEFDSDFIKSFKDKLHPFKDLRVSWRVFHRAGWSTMWDFIREISKALAKDGSKHIPR